MKRTIADAFDTLRIIEQDSGTHFSVYGPVAPILLICVLRKAISRRIGAQENLEAFLEVSSWLNCMTYEINGSSLESVIDSVSTEAGDEKKSLPGFFRTSISAFDEITHKNEKYRDWLDDIFRNIEWDNSFAVFEEAIRLYMGFSLKDIEIVSNPSISRLAKTLLQVSDGDAFSDFVCGSGLSSSIILGDIQNVYVTLSDRDINSFALTTIACFLQNRKNNGKIQDSLSYENFKPEKLADKIFIDPPFRAKLDNPFEFDGVQIKEASCAAVMKAVTSLNEGGISVITINSGFTFGSQYAIESVRKYLVDNHYLSAVISLPAMLPRLSVLTTVLVVSKRRNDNVVMIDLSKKNNDLSLFVYDRRYQALSFTDEGIETINSIVNNSEIIPGISSIVDYSTIRGKDYVLLPGAYIVDEENEKKTVSEIDAKIKETIGEIQSLLSRLDTLV